MPDVAGLAVILEPGLYRETITEGHRHQPPNENGGSRRRPVSLVADELLEHRQQLLTLSGLQFLRVQRAIMIRVSSLEMLFDHGGLES
jgi:hypothetical protein